MRHKTITFFLTLICLLTVMPVLAHGGGLIYVAGEPAGDYRVTVWVAPNQVQAGKTLHFTVAIVEGDSNNILLDEAVTIDVYASGATTPLLSVPATTDQSINKLFYETDIPQAPGAGMYTVVTTVNGRLGTGNVSFDFEILPAKTSINWLLVGLVALGLMVVVGGFLSRRASPASPASPS